MKYKFLVIFITIFFHKCQADNEVGNCGVEYVPSGADDTQGVIDWGSKRIQPITIMDVDSLSLNYKFSGNLDINITAARDAKAVDYFEFQKQDPTLTIKTSENFQNIEEDYLELNNDYITLIVNLVFTCEDKTDTISLTLYVKDTNNHSPTFEKDSYTYKVPSPLPPGIDITGFDSSITVKDLDITNENIEFTLEPTDERFELSSESLGLRRYRAIIRLKSYLNLQDNLLLKLTATDKPKDGTKKLTSSTTITLVKDSDNSLEITPTFSEPIYKFKYSEKDGKPSIEPESDNIIISSTNPKDLTVSLDDETYFKAIYDPETKTASITTTGTPIGKVSNSVLTLTLKASSTDDSTGKTIIYVSIPPENQLVAPKFSQAFYTATYDLNAEAGSIIKVDPAIKVTEDAEVTISDTASIIDSSTDFKPSDYFDIKKDNNQWIVTLTQKLPNDVIKNGADVVITLIAKVQNVDESGEASLVITVPKIKIPKFKSTSYLGTYNRNADGTDTLTLEEEIELDDDSTEAIVSIDKSDNSENFKITCDSSSHKCTLSLTANLPDDVLQKETDIILTIKAAFSESSDFGTTTVIITLPHSEAPKFTKSVYNAEYSLDDNKNGIITMSKDPITIAFPQDKEVSVSFAEVTEYFELSQDTDDKTKWIVSVKTNLPDNELKNGVMVLTLQANIQGDLKNVGTSVLVIKLQGGGNSMPGFEQPIYTAQYELNVDGDKVTLSDKIQLDSEDNDVKFAFVDLYSDYFDFAYNEPQQITVKKKLDETIINENKEILLTLQASKAEVKVVTIIDLKLPHTDTKETLKFDQPSYEFSYKVDGDTHSIDQKGQTITISEDDVIVHIVDSTYSKNFALDENFNIVIQTPLEDEVLNIESDILLVLQATLEGYDDGFTTVLIDLPKKESKVPPQFSDSSYTGNYVLGESLDSIELTKEITLKEVDEKVTVNIDGKYSEYFDIVKKDTGFEIKVTKNLEDDILIKEANVVLTLKATLEDANGEAALIINLPKETPPASFSKAVYSAEYQKNKDENSLDTIEIKDGPIQLTGNYLEDTEVTFETPDELKDYFSLTKTDDSYELTLLKNLEKDYLNANSKIVLTLIASLKSSTVKATSIVIIKLPDPITSPEFKKSPIIGKYQKEPTLKIELEENIEINYSNLEDVTIKAENPYDSNIEIIYNTDSKLFEIKVNKELDDDQEEVYVTLKATIPDAIDSKTAVLVVKMPKDANAVVPEFSATYYEALYNSENDVHTINCPDIIITSDHASETVVKLADETLTPYFDVSLDGDHWKLSLKQNLPDDELQLNMIYLNLEATLDGSAGKGKAIVIIHLRDDTLEVPKFDKPYYSGEYTEEDTLVNVDPIDVIWTDSTNKKVITITPEGYEENFDIQLGDNNKWMITLKKALGDKKGSNPALYIPLKATVENSVAYDIATFILTLPEKKITFSEKFYTGSYANDIKAGDKISTDKEISVTSGADVVISSEDYKTNFKVDCQEGKCTLTLIAKLDDKVLETNAEIFLILEASKQDVKDKAYTTVIIHLPLQDKVQAPKFAKAVYVATYNEAEDGQDTILLEKLITIENVDDYNKITIEPQSEYAEFFNIVHEEKGWNVKLKKNFDDTQIAQVSVSVILTATKEGVSVKGEAGLVIQMPKKDKIIYFEKNVYISNYDESGQIIIDEEIKLVGDSNDEATLELSGDYKDLFDLSYSKGSVVIVLKAPLDETILQQNAVISVDIKATLGSDTDSSTLIVKLPKTSTPGAPQFDKVIYNGNYRIKNDADFDELTFDNIKIIGVEDVTSAAVTIESETYGSYFNINPNVDHWELSLTQNLPSDIIDDEISLVLNLKATVVNVDLSGYSGLVIQLPKKLTNSSFYFDRVVYIAEYKDSKIVLDTDIILEGESVDNLNVDLEGEHKDDFSAKYENGKITVEPKGDFSKVTDPIISVDIVVSRPGDQIEIAKASLVVKFTENVDADGDNDDKTGLIAAVAVLAVLLIASLVGSVVFYFLKFKRAANYKNMDEPGERFRKNSPSGNTKLKIEHPTRRPTGVIKYSLENYPPDEITKEDLAASETNKSVQFDTENIDELEIKKPEGDTDDEVNDEEVERRSSTV